LHQSSPRQIWRTRVFLYPEAHRSIDAR